MFLTISSLWKFGQWQKMYLCLLIHVNCYLDFMYDKDFISLCAWNIRKRIKYFNIQLYIIWEVTFLETGYMFKFVFYFCKTKIIYIYFVTQEPPYSAICNSRICLLSAESKPFSERLQSEEQLFLWSTLSLIMSTRWRSCLTFKLITTGPLPVAGLFLCKK